MTYDAMLGAMAAAWEIARETGCSEEAAFFSERNLANIQVAVAQAMQQSAALTPRERN